MSSKTLGPPGQSRISVRSSRIGRSRIASHRLHRGEPDCRSETHPLGSLAKIFNRVLDPMDRISEVLFALIMVLTYTGTLSVATADHAEVRTMLIGALGCNLAWGLVDAVMYLLGVLAERGPARPAGSRGMLLHPITGRDVIGAIAVFLLVFLSTFPLALPFVLVD